MFHELLSRDRGDGCDTGQPQGVRSEAYLNSTSQDPTPEDARKDGQIHGRSRQLVKYPGYPHHTTLWWNVKVPVAQMNFPANAYFLCMI